MPKWRLSIEKHLKAYVLNIKMFSLRTQQTWGRHLSLKMDIPTGDSPPITQRPYTLALRHVQLVQEEIVILEKAGIIAKSVSSWASPIVIVPKKTAPGEPPRRRMCVDYCMLNQLLS